MNGVSNITNKILEEARAWSQTFINEAKAEAETVHKEFAEKAAAETKATLSDAETRAVSTMERVKSQADMDRRKSILTAKQKAVGEAFDKALAELSAKPEEERALLMARMAINYQQQDAELIFNSADQKVVGPAVVDTVNSIYAQQQVKEIFSGSFMEKVKKLVVAKPSKLTVKMSNTVGDFSGGLVIKEGDIENNCTFEVLLGAVRDELEGEVSSILFG